MGEVLLAIGGMTLIIMRVFQWARKMMVELNNSNTLLQQEITQLTAQNLRLEIKIEHCSSHRDRAIKAARHYRRLYLEEKVDNLE